MKKWKVKYHKKFDSWHPLSEPTIVDEMGQNVFRQNVDHPGKFDKLLYENVNLAARAPQMLAFLHKILPHLSGELKEECIDLIDEADLS